MALIFAQNLCADTLDVSVSFLFFLVEGVIINNICTDSGLNGIHVEVLHNVFINLTELEKLAMDRWVGHRSRQLSRRGRTIV